MRRSTFYVLIFSLLLLSVSACGALQQSDDIPVTVDAPAPGETAVIVDDDEGYPAPLAPDATAAPAAYPGEEDDEEFLAEPPDPERNLPAASGDTAVIGGVLIREVTESGFVPITPRSLSLGEVILSDDGQPAFIRQREDAPEAELFPTGVFVFNNIPPGDYGIIIDLGFAQFPLTDEAGEELIVSLEGGEALDLGQIFVSIPGD